VADRCGSVRVVWKRIEHDGETYETGGLTGVFTFPDFRRRGYGTQVVEAASRCAWPPTTRTG
jgi:GNAT superfamily N-acetyltransferase